jgi:hypothetical protein
VPWEHAEDKLEASARIADPTCLPVGVNRLMDPYSWPPEQITSFRCYIEDGQRQWILDERIFQFARVAGSQLETSLHVEIAAQSELRYDTSSRLYVARILHNDHSDLQAMREIVNQLPSSGVSRYQLLSDEYFKDARMHTANSMELQYLLYYMDDYEDGAPVQVRELLVHMLCLTLSSRPNLDTGRSYGRPLCGFPKSILPMRRMWIHWVAGGFRKNTSRPPPSMATSIACEHSRTGSSLGSWIIPRPT